MPLTDAAHIRTAIVQFGRTRFDSAAQREEARVRIILAARRHNVELTWFEKTHGTFDLAAEIATLENAMIAASEEYARAKIGGAPFVLERIAARAGLRHQVATVEITHEEIAERMMLYWAERAPKGSK